MAVVIRLSRGGTKKKPFYNIVVAHKEFKRDGRHLACIGRFDPKVKNESERLIVDMTLFNEWKSKGAVPSETVGHLVKRAAQSTK